MSVSHTFENDSREWSPVSWAFHVWSWIALLVLFVLLEVFVDPLTASLVLCLKLGWRDLLVALRLRGHDNPRIVHALSLYCLAQACFKVALAGVLVWALIVACEVLLGIPQPIERFLAGFCLLFSGLILGALTVGFAAVRTVEYRVRPWIDVTLYQHLLDRSQPLTCHGTFNRVPALLRMGMILATLTLLPGVYAGFHLLFAKGNLAGVMGPLIFITLWWQGVRPMWTALKQSASSPAECWDA